MKPAKITLVPHTHWDREWYGPFDEFLPRLVAMMDTLIDHADRGFPHFHLDGQTAMIDDYLGVRPEREGDVMRLARSGKLSVGPWVTQMDEFLASGESHIRNLEMGLARARELGPALEIGYLPDQFGHIGQMPQILRLARIERAVVWRGVPEVVDKTAFWWEAPDGSRVLTEYLAFGYFLGGDIEQRLDPAALADSLRRKAEQVEPLLATDRMLITVGSDHSGPDVTLPERLEAAGGMLPGVDVSIGSLADHLQDDPAEGLPAWRGELRSSARAHLLPNVYSARVSQKRERGRVEALLERYAEPLAALVPGVEWPAEELRRAWTLMLWNGAHDSACGCSHDRVAEDVDERFRGARAWAELIVARALHALASQVEKAGALRFNPSPFEREGVPGLGWRVDPAPAAERTVKVEPSVEDGWVFADGIAFTVEDEPDVGDLYNFCYAKEGQVASAPERIGAFGSDVIAAFDGVDVRIGVSRRQDEPFLRLEGEIDNRRPDHRVRLRVRLPEEAARSLAGSPFELVDRGLVSEGSSLEAPSPTWPARGVVMAGGLATFHEGVFEYEVDGSELVITLLRCVGTISRRALATRPFEAGPDVPTPGAQMLGKTKFHVGLRTGAVREDLMRDWERFALPLLGIEAEGGGPLPSRGCLLEIRPGGAVLSNIRRSDGAVEVRVWNPSQERSCDVRIEDQTISLGPAAIATIGHGWTSGAGRTAKG